MTDLYVVQLNGDVSTRIQIGCEDAANEFAGWAEDVGYSVETYWTDEPIPVSAGEAARVQHVIGDYERYLND